MKTKFYSWRKGKLAEGCKHCVLGRKSVLFITGLCNKKCWYCPISDKKKNKDVIYINERPVKNFKDIIDEIKLCESKGVGITGGDPLIVLDKVVEYIKLLKRKFGKKFHIHLYTPLNLVTKAKLSKLFKAGLDEIRFHPDLDGDVLDKIKLARDFDWSVGVEIPVIPGYGEKIKDLIDKIDVDFLNLNELEISDTNANKIVEKGFRAKDDISYGVKGSQELALKLLKYCEKKKFRVHYCTVKLKDAVQLINRIKLRAKNVKKKYDILTKNGSLIRGVIEGRNLEKLRRDLIEEFDIPGDLIEIDDKRILTSIVVLEDLKKDLKKKKLKFYIVEEIPTWDHFEIQTWDV